MVGVEVCVLSYKLNGLREETFTVHSVIVAFCPLRQWFKIKEKHTDSLPY